MGKWESGKMGKWENGKVAPLNRLGDRDIHSICAGKKTFFSSIKSKIKNQQSTIAPPPA
jgi:hypothetical protein